VEARCRKIKRKKDEEKRWINCIEDFRQAGVTTLKTTGRQRVTLNDVAEHIRQWRVGGGIYG